MSTLTLRGHRHRSEEDPDPDPDPQPKPKRKRRWRLAVVAMVLLLLLYLLPGIVAHTALFGWILDSATGDLHGKVTARSVSLGWFSPIVVQGVEVRDAEDKPVLEVAKLSSDKTLASILFDTSMPGRFQIDKPKLTVVVRDDGSNVEDLLANYLTPKEKPSGRVSVVLEVNDGSVVLVDRGRQRTWQIENLQLELSTPAGAAGPLKLETSATIADPQRPGRIKLELSMRQHDPKDRPPAKGASAEKAPSAGAPATAGRLKVEAEAVPLEMFDSLVARFAPQTHLAGRLSSEIDAQWGGQRPDGNVVRKAHLTADGLTLDTRWLGTDRVQLQQLRADCQLTWQNGRIEIERCWLGCDLGNVSLAGTLQLGDRGGSLLDSLLNQTHTINGRVDLARLARMLPETLRIRRQTQINSGQVELALSSRPGPQGMVWRGRVAASNLTAVHRGRQIAWERPILITLAAYQSPQGPVVESLKCKADFFNLHAIGTPESLAADASFDLKQLAEKLGRFVDLGGVYLAGDGWAHLNWKRSPQQQFEADAELQVRDFQLALPNRKPWVEENVVAFLSVAGRTDLAGDTRLQTASLQCRAGADRIDARITQPVLDFRDGGTWPVELRISGPLDPWPARIGTWYPMDDWKLAGTYELTLQATGSIGELDVRRARLAVAGLQLAAPGLNVNEPNVELVACGRWDAKLRQLQLDTSTLTSSSLSLQTDNLLLALPDEAPLEMTGLISCRGDLQRLQQWIADPAEPPAWNLAGQFAGTAQLRQSAGLIDAVLEADVANLIVTLASGKKFHEPAVHLAARGGWEPQAAVLRLEQAELTSATLGGNAKGQIARTDEKTNVQLAGQINYDLERLSGMLRPYIGQGVRIAGRGSSPASFSGPLSLARAQAAAGLRWDRANLYGFQVGPGQLKANLADGVLKVQPLDLAVSRGRVHLEPRLRLAPEPTELTLPQCQLAQQVQIDPAMCDSLLKYVAPVLAGVTAAQGSFSIELQGCRIPLEQPSKGELAGRFIIHSVQVGPGPLVRELAVLLGRASPARLRRESVVPFRMTGGRVYHQGLELIFPDLTIRTRGSVGLDQTVDLLAEMPIPPKWLGNNRLGTALRNQTIKLPISGTLNKPRIDRRVLDQLSRQFIENAARGLIEDEVNKKLKELQGLFAPRQ